MTSRRDWQRKSKGRVPLASEMRGGSQRKKLQTPHVFVQTELSLPGDWIEVNSSRVMRCRYDQGLSQVHVNFRDGTPWVYEDVPEGIFEMFITSQSMGRFIHEVLDRYPYRRASVTETSTW
jgi:hypothetical protein